MNPESGLDLDQLLDRELSRQVGALQGPSPDPGQATYHAVLVGGKSMSLFSSITATATSKAAIGLAVAALAVGGGPAVATAAGSGSAPSNWGQTVVKTVQACKTAHEATENTPKTASTARQNVGQCVSAVAKTHGAQERALHSAARTGATGGAPTDHSSGPPAGHPTGRSSEVPAGQPKNVPPVPTPSHPTGKP